MASAQEQRLQRLAAYSPAGRTCLVTGGTQGIGRAVVEELAALGARVFTCARSADDLEALLQHCRGQGWDVCGCVADVAAPADRQRLVAAVSEAYGGRLQVLFNNVGTNIRKKAVEYSQEDWDRLMSVNLESAFALSTACHPLLKAAGDAVVLFNSSVAGGPTALGSGVLYAMTKAAINQLVRCLTCEWARDGIRALAVAPWYTATPLAQQVLRNPDFEAAVHERTPLARVAQPEEVARCVAFLASPAASYLAGVVLPIDGGYSVKGLYREGDPIPFVKPASD